jgi:hypothetical protein
MEFHKYELSSSFMIQIYTLCIICGLKALGIQITSISLIATLDESETGRLKSRSDVLEGL